LSDPDPGKSNRSMKAITKMKKLEIRALWSAYASL
jgi:hypothetical protein